jgi:hypothetical protein
MTQLQQRITRIYYQESSGLSTLLKDNVPFHAIVENEARKLGYGQITVNVKLKDGKVIFDSINLVVNKRIRY